MIECFLSDSLDTISQKRERTFPTDYMKKQNLEPLLSLKFKAPLFWWLSAPWVSDPIPSLWDGVFHITRKTWTKNPTLKTKMLTWKTLKTNCENSRVPSRAWVSELASGSRWCKRDFKHEAKTIYTSFTFHKIVPPSENPPLSEHFSQNWNNIFLWYSECWVIETYQQWQIFSVQLRFTGATFPLYPL